LKFITCSAARERARGASKARRRSRAYDFIKANGLARARASTREITLAAEYGRRTPTTPTRGCCSACVDLVFAKFWVAISLSPLSLSLESADGGSAGISYLRAHAHAHMRERARMRAFSLARYRASRNALTLKQQVKVKQILDLSSSSFHCSRLRSALPRYSNLSTSPECREMIELDLDRSAEFTNLILIIYVESRLSLYA